MPGPLLPIYPYKANGIDLYLGEWIDANGDLWQVYVLIDRRILEWYVTKAAERSPPEYTINLGDPRLKFYIDG